VGHVVAVLLAAAVDVYALAKMRELLDSPR
jgi:hypothetical protein